MKWAFLMTSIFNALMALLFLWLIIFYLGHYSASWRLVPMFALLAIFVFAAYKAFSRFRGLPAPELTRRPNQALLENRTAQVLVLALCSIESVWSWASISRGAQHKESITYVFLYALVTFVAVSIAHRSSSLADRIVFGAIGGAFALLVIRNIPLTSNALLAINTAYAVMWTIAAVVTAVVLARSFKLSL